MAAQEKIVKSAQPVTAPNHDELMSKFMDVQEHEIACRENELDLRRESDRNQFEFAKLALEAQSKALESERSHKSSMRWMSLWFGISFFIVLLVFAGYCIHSGKDQIAMEIFRAAIYLISGGVLGYGYSKSNKDPDTPKQ